MAAQLPIALSLVRSCPPHKCQLLELQVGSGISRQEQSWWWSISRKQPKPGRHNSVSVIQATGTDDMSPDVQAQPIKASEMMSCRLAAMKPAGAVMSYHLSVGQTDPAVAADMGPRPEQRLMCSALFTNKPVQPSLQRNSIPKFLASTRFCSQALFPRLSST